jgi:hypothetical protein
MRRRISVRLNIAITGSSVLEHVLIVPVDQGGRQSWVTTRIGMWRTVS